MIGSREQSAVSSQQSAENQRLKSQIANRKSQIGFTLLEMMITMFIIIILLSVAIPTYQRSMQQARESVLKQNLHTIRQAIQQYNADKGKLPKSIDDLVTDEYLSEKPTDPVAGKTEWTEVTGDDINSTEGEQGLKDVKSTAEGEDDEGVKYQDY